MELVSNTDDNDDCEDVDIDDENDDEEKTTSTSVVPMKTTGGTKGPPQVQRQR